jgi:phage-related protein
MREAIFHEGALEAIRVFSQSARRQTGKAILDLQLGLTLGMPLSRPMPAVGVGVKELRVSDRQGAYRTFYYTKSRSGVLIFHAFTKKTPKTPGREIELARRRLREMLNEEAK